ncbi:MAG TPA: alkaline phosphatase family protein [Thermoanaerobaculia bacterium]|nr:alkaline phosphatase family protein [Thermoanaerobaculia bacterium]
MQHLIAARWREAAGRARPARRAAGLAISALALVSGGAALAQEAAAPGQAPGKVVVLGFDGADAELTRQWMDEGKLPNLARLRDQGTFAPLRSTIPSQTPVSWSTFATGLNPGRHSIFDFLRRDPANYRPTFAAFDETTVPFLWGERNGLVLGLIGAGVVLLAVFLLLKLFKVRTARSAVAAAVLALVVGAGLWVAAARLLPVERPLAVNRQQGETFWEVLGAAGHRVRVIRVPVTFPPEEFEGGELLSGLGVPDLSMRIGKPFYFTSELFFQPKSQGDFSIELVELIDNQGVIPTKIKGPPNELFPEGPQYIEIPMTLTVAEDRSHLDIEVSGERLRLAPGEWSDWVEMRFPFNPILKLRGIGRFKLLALEDDVKLYLSPIQFDPENLPPILEITAPGEYVEHLTERFGRFKTMGWAIDTWSITEGTLDEASFLEDVEATVAKSHEMLSGSLEEMADWDVLVHYFEFTDRVQHVMFRFMDERHPLYEPALAERWGGSILEAYQRMDGIVGEVMAALPEDSLLLVVSDHGFAPWRRTMNYNTWLAQEGYLVLQGQGPERANLEDLFDQGEFFVNVDWSRTRAYAMGLGNIYVNLRGREAQGIVEPGAEYDQLVAEIQAKLTAFVDPTTGENPVAHVFTRDEAYGGVYDPQLIPDMFPSNSSGYRVGWQDSLGIVAQSVLEDNTDIWSGDHCSVYPPLVNGIFFSSRPMPGATDPYMADVPATLLSVLGVEPPVDLDGQSLE